MKADWKKIKFILGAVVLAFCVWIGSADVVKADTTDDGMFDYTDTDSGVTITKYKGSGADVQIPSEIGGKKVTDIGVKAFVECHTLTNVVVPDGVTGIGSFAFADCDNLTAITLPDSVTNIGDCAFANCGSLESIRIPDGVTKIDNYTFSYCIALTSVTIPKGVTSIGTEAFASCKSIKEITIPDSVTKLGDNAFSYCIALTDITIPKGITDIEYAAFDQCNSLSAVYYDGCEGLWENVNIALHNDAILAATKYYSAHTYRTYTTEPAGGKDGERIVKCSVCGKIQSKETIPYDLYTDPANEIPEGLTTWKQKEGADSFIYRLYNIILTREPDDAGYTYWDGLLQDNNKTAAEVAQGFVFSEEFQKQNYNDVQYIRILYCTMFGRNAEPDGLRYWAGLLENGMSREFVYKGFAESAEFTDICESCHVERGSVDVTAYRDQNVGATGYVSRLYTKMLDRKYDVDGLEYWCKVFITKEMSPEDIAIKGFLHSKEFMARGLSDEEYVICMYQTFLDREPDESGLRYWTEMLQSREITRDDLVYGFSRSAEFQNIMKKYGL